MLNLISKSDLTFTSNKDCGCGTKKVNKSKHINKTIIYKKLKNNKLRSKKLKNNKLKNNKLKNNKIIKIKKYIVKNIFNILTNYLD